MGQLFVYKIWLTKLTISQWYNYCYFCLWTCWRAGFHLFPNNNQLPQSVLNKVGNNTIDSYPWNTQILLENKLNFMPRPIFQSYAAYTTDLEQMNIDQNFGSILDSCCQLFSQNFYRNLLQGFTINQSFESARVSIQINDKKFDTCCCFWILKNLQIMFI